MLKIGIVDMSPGNGHMFSFSAIVNGLNHRNLGICPFPNIQDYILKYETPVRELKNKIWVQGIWMPSLDYAHAVSSFSNIPQVFSTPETLMNAVDAVIVTNDKPDSNRQDLICKLIQFGKPIFIDKVPAKNMLGFKQLIHKQKFSGQLYCSSAMRFHPEFLHLNLLDYHQTIKISVPNTWNLYAVHAVELMYSFLGPKRKIEISDLKTNLDGATQRVIKVPELQVNFEITASNMKETPFTVSIEKRNKSSFSITMSDPFLAFVNLLGDWHDSIKFKKQNWIWNDTIFDVLGEIS
jgi:hypothetical protein